MVENFDPNTIEDEGLRQVFITLMNLVETLSAKVAPVLSSEKERREPKAHHKAKKQAQIRIDRVEVVKMDTSQLPTDTTFKGYEEVIV